MCTYTICLLWTRFHKPWCDKNVASFEIHLVMGSPVEFGFLDFGDNSCKSTSAFVDSN